MTVQCSALLISHGEHREHREIFKPGLSKTSQNSVLTGSLWDPPLTRHAELVSASATGSAGVPPVPRVSNTYCHAELVYLSCRIYFGTYPQKIGIAAIPPAANPAFQPLCALRALRVHKSPVMLNLFQHLPPETALSPNPPPTKNHANTKTTIPINHDHLD
jgi:hypothetical protein